MSVINKQDKLGWENVIECKRTIYLKPKFAH